MISLEDVSYTYPQSKGPAVKNINLNIREKEFVAIMGRNGSGKSTLTRLLNGLLLPDAGEVTIDGLSSLNLENLVDIRKRIGLLFPDPDSQLLSNLVEEEIAFGPENLGLVHTSMQTFDEKTQKISVGPSHPYRGQVLEDLLRANQVGNSSVMIKRECLDKAGDFDVSMRGCEDWDMWIRVSRSCLFEFIDKELVIFTAHSSNSSADMRRMISGREIMLNKFFSLYRLYPDIHALQHYIIGIQCFKEEMMERGRGHFTMAFKYSRPGNISIKCRSAIQIFLSLSGFRSYQKIKKYVHSHFLYLT